MTEKAKKNLEMEKAKEKEKRPPKESKDRPSKSQDGQQHGTSRVSK